MLEKPTNRNKVALKTLAATGAMVLALTGVSELQQHRNPYGYDPARNPSPPANINNGINPADIHTP